MSLTLLHPRALDISGEYFEKLLVLRKLEGTPYWVCVCECGKLSFPTSGNLRKPNGTKSCGCIQREQLSRRSKKHGEKVNGSTTEYRAWQGMKDRCYNRSACKYKSHGGRGVQVCERWLESFENFLADMGRKPSPELSLDRFPNNDGNYEPSNCRWATAEQQANNRRTRRF